MKSFLAFLLLSSLSCLAQPDPLLTYDSARRVPWNSGGGYARDEYAWFLKNTGQPSTLYLNGIQQSLESGTNSLNITDAWAIQSNAPSVLVAIVDTGCDTNNPDLTGIVRNGWTFNVTSRHGFDDNQVIRNPPSHGTMIAALLAGRRNNAFGSCGVAPETPLLIVGTGYAIADVASGIAWSVTNGARIICLAWGTSENNPALSNACFLAQQSNVVIVASAPNLSVNLDTYPDYPAAWKFPNLLSVSCTDRSGNLYVSSTGTNVIAAPGRNLVTTGINGEPLYASGTSFSAPLVAGILALVMERFPGSTPQAYINHLLATATTTPDGISKQINPAAALTSHDPITDTPTDLKLTP